MKNSTKILLLIIIISILIRVSAINNPLYDDETNLVQSLYNPGPYLTVNPISMHPHPPIGPWLYMSFGLILGAKVWVFRLVPILFSIINLLLIFYITRKYYSEKAALWASALYGLSFYSVLGSLQVDVEGSVLITGMLLTTIFYLKFRETDLKRWLMFSGVSLGFVLLTKYVGSFIFLVIILHSLTHKIEKLNIKSVISILHYKNIWRTFWENIMILIFGLGLFSLYPILMTEIFNLTVSHSSRYFAFNISSMAIGMLLFWATPLLLGLAFLKMRKYETKDLFWILWVIVIIAINVFMTNGRPPRIFLIGGIADYSRYMMNLAAPLSILAGTYLSRIKFDKKNSAFIGILTAAMVIVLYIVNYTNIHLVPRDAQTYFTLIKNLEWNFIFTYTTSSGNLLGINFMILAFSWIISAILILLFIITKKQTKNIYLTLFLILAFATNIFLVSEYIGPVTSLYVNKADLELINYVKANKGDLNLYSNDEGILLLANGFRTETDHNNIHTGVYCENCKELKKDLNGMVALLDFPRLDNKFKDLIKDCTLIKTISSMNIKLGFVFVCGDNE